MQDAPLMLSVSGARGIVGRSMTPAVAARMARAYAGWVRSRGVQRPVLLLGRDGRGSGSDLSQGAAAALVACGCDAVELGIVATPTVGFMTRELRADGAIVITASHNPVAWNGLKLLDREGAAPAPGEAAEIIDRFRRDEPVPPAATAGVARTHEGADEAHVARVISLVDRDAIRKSRRAVTLDSVNAAGTRSGALLLRELGCTVDHLNAERTGSFAHPPEPLRENLGGLSEAVCARGSQVGFAQDPDADRLAIVDERGAYIGEECTLALASLQALRKAGSGTLAANLSTSRMVDDIAAGFPGSRVLRTPVGEAHVVQALRAEGGLIGGEGNGGVIWPSVCWVRDSLGAMALVLELLATDARPLSALVAELPRYAMVKRKFALPGSGGSAAVAERLALVRAAFAHAAQDSRDGLRVDLESGWFHLRASNTEPIVRVIAEARTEASAAALADACMEAAGLAPAQ